MTLKKLIAYQGEPGANSHIACAENYPDYDPLPCATFEDAFAALQDGTAELGMIPIENSIAGRVADIHNLLPASGLHIIGETFLPIHFQLLGLPGATIEGLRSVHSHVHALGQCRKIIRKHGLKPVVAGDTAGSAREISQWRDHPRRGRRGRSAQHDAFRRPPADPEMGACAERTGRDDFRVSRSQRAGGALQGAGRFCDQWREHDEARELHG